VGNKHKTEKYACLVSVLMAVQHTGCCKWRLYYPDWSRYL